MAHPTKHSGNLFSYISGFVLSIIMTLLAFYVVNEHVQHGHLEFSHRFVITIISVLAILQLYVQLFFFLHLGKEAKPRWNLLAFLFALLVVFIVVFGSLWIMHNLDYNMTDHEVDTYIQDEEGIHH